MAQYWPCSFWFNLTDGSTSSESIKHKEDLGKYSAIDVLLVQPCKIPIFFSHLISSVSNSPMTDPFKMKYTDDKTMPQS